MFKFILPYHLHNFEFLFFICIKLVSEKSKAASKKESTQTKEEPGSLFQRQRVDMLLGELLRKFPPPMPPQMQQHVATQASGLQNIKNEINQDQQISIKQETSDNNALNNMNSESSPGSTTVNNIEIKTEPNVEMKPPPEKKMKM